MATAKKLPSGSWRCQVYDYTNENGKIVRKSFTSDIPGAKGKREAEFLAAEFAREKKEKESGGKILFREAIDKYINSRENVLSPRSVLDYKRKKDKDLATLLELNVFDITQEIIQNFVNTDAKTHSPKTVRDNHGLIFAVIKDVRANFSVNTVLPKVKKPDLYIPKDEDVKKLIEKSKGTELELPILLAAFGPMRRGEICALHSTNIKGNTVHVIENMVLDKDRKWVIKQPKSVAGDRYINYPNFVAVKWKNITGKITELNPNDITIIRQIIILMNYFTRNFTQKNRTPIFRDSKRADDET